MSFTENRLKQKEESHHPWEKSIKGLYSNTYKYGHNSANNTIFPPKKVAQKDTHKIPEKDRIKFTVIGDRVTKDFIYCYYLVKGLHKYRPKEFKNPEIRGLSSVEWPAVLSDLKRQHGGNAFLITSTVAVLKGDKVIGGKKELQDFVQTKYIYNVNLDYRKEGIQQFANYIKSSGKPCAYFNISIDGASIGSLIFMLYADVVPYTCNNFLKLCDASRQGYSGTPVHRIVKDCWIQCGGFGLKNNPALDCENYVVPHDKRGVLGMANDGRNNDCSTQFFVLLQPAPWMAHKYVAFGQLIEGEGTLSKIENVPTWYESPTAKIMITKAGVFNMECQRVPINKNTRAYLEGHIEDLIQIGKIFYEELLQKVFVAIQLDYLRQLEALRTANEDAEEEAEIEKYQQKKAEIRKELELVRLDHNPSSSDNTVNKEFDVDVYEYEDVEYSNKHMSVEATPSIVVEPEKMFHIPLTDVPYPDEVDSTFNLKKVLQGHYCHEADIEGAPAERKKMKPDLTIPSDLLTFMFDSYVASDDESDTSVDSEDKLEIGVYLKENIDKTSFAGRIVKKMAHKRKKYDVFDQMADEKLKYNTLTDEELRIYRVATREYKCARDKKVSIVLSSASLAPGKIKRRQTGFIRPTDLHKIHALIRMSATSIDMSSDDEIEGEGVDEDELYRKVRIAPTSLKKQYRHGTSFASHSELCAQDAPRPSVLARLYDEVAIKTDEELPTLKDYKSHTDGQKKPYLFLTNSRMSTDDESSLDRFPHRSVPQYSIDHVLALQHGTNFRKISSDYVKTIDTLEQNMPNSIRTVEFMKKRPSISITQYKLKNQKYQDNMKKKEASEDQTRAGTPTKIHEKMTLKII